ncbi:MAG: hypothetical protein ACH346_01775 [Chthoniobacterales bacterium]
MVYTSPIIPKSSVQQVDPLQQNTASEEQALAYAKRLETPSTNASTSTVETAESESNSGWATFHKAFINNIEQSGNRQAQTFRENMKKIWMDLSSPSSKS